MQPFHITAQSRLPAWLLWAVLCVAVALACQQKSSSSNATPSSNSVPSGAGPVRIQGDWQKARLMPGHEIHVGRKQIPCEKCHEPQETASGPHFNKPKSTVCRACHEKEAEIRHALGALTSTDTASAAASAKTPPAQLTADCTDCHAFLPDQLASHNPDFQVAPITTDAGYLQSAWNCRRCHAPGNPDAAPAEGFSAPRLGRHFSADCKHCHTPHGKTTATAKDCTECHENIALTHGNPELAQHECTSCHQSPHRATKVGADTCLSCHADSPPLVPKSAIFASHGAVAGHDTCINCHKPHSFSKSQVSNCTDCHQNQMALAADRVPAHANCRSCHSPHAVKSGVEQSCKRCHQDLKSDHPRAQAHGDCTTCHIAHPHNRRANVDVDHSGRIPCQNCHSGELIQTGTVHTGTGQAVAANTGVGHAKGLPCTSCHKPHQFHLSKVKLGLCASCHTAQAKLASHQPGHTLCASCHTQDVHQGAAPLQSCAECHSQVSHRLSKGHATLAMGSAISGLQEGAGACLNCHNPHSGAQQTQCATCHTQQSQSAPLGHQECNHCHDAHSGTLTKRGSDCRSCHESQAHAMHGGIPGGCQNCHRAHGPKLRGVHGPASPPACTTCHNRSTLPALHKVAEHNQCLQCHSGHTKLLPTLKQTCVGCHEQQRTGHNPNAGSCASCHLFTRL